MGVLVILILGKYLEMLTLIGEENTNIARKTLCFIVGGNILTVRITVRNCIKTAGDLMVWTLWTAQEHHSSKNRWTCRP